MTDKPSASTRPSARPPLPSIAPPTEDIDSEWGADDMPAPAKLPQIAAAPVASAPPAASPSYPPAPEPPRVAAQPSSPAPAAGPAATAPATTGYNPLRKQTLLGMAPVMPTQRSEPPAATKPASEPPRPSSTSSLPPRPSQPVEAKPAASDNPLRKQTLLGIAPVIPERQSQPAPVAEAAPPAAPEPAAPEPAAPEPAAATAAPAPAEPDKQPEAESSIAALEAAQAAAADAVSSDAPITRDVKSSRPPTPRIEPHVSVGDHDLPELKPRRSAWVYVLAAAAVLGGGVFLLRKMDRPPEQLDESLGRPIRPASEQIAASPKADEEPDDSDSEPNPSEPTEPEPLKATAPSETTTAPSAAPAVDAAKPSASAPVAAAPSSTPATAGELKTINIASDPPGARMFHRGKEVGTTPFTLEIPAGERRSYEMGMPGFVTRKVVIDGTKSDISIGLKPEG